MSGPGSATMHESPAGVAQLAEQPSCNGCNELDLTCERARTIGEIWRVFAVDDLRAELTRRDVHLDMLDFCRSGLLQQSYFHAVLEPAKIVGDKRRDLVGVTGEPARQCHPAMSESPRRTELRIEEFSFDANPAISPAVIGQLSTCGLVKVGRPVAP
jgi:hypothetical protein